MGSRGAKRAWQPPQRPAAAGAPPDARVAEGLARVAELDGALAAAAAAADAAVRDACPERWAARQRRRTARRQAALQRAIARREGCGIGLWVFHCAINMRGCRAPLLGVPRQSPPLGTSCSCDLIMCNKYILWG